MKTLSDLAAQCIRCGFCLESCPTFQLSGMENEGPRGRIYLAKSAEQGVLQWADVGDSMDSCLGCRSCETACPSGVEYGQLLEIARCRIEGDRPNRIKRLLLAIMTRPHLLSLQLNLSRILPSARVPSFVAKMFSNESAVAELPRAYSERSWSELALDTMPKVRGQVTLLLGCAMSVLYQPVHDATRRLMRRVGYETTDIEGTCCGALHAHNGFLGEAHQMALRLFQKVPAGLPLIVNSAGCGSWLKQAARDANLQTRVLDATEFLESAGLATLLRESSGLNLSLTYHDACHLSHGQQIRLQPRDMLKAIPKLKYIELQDSDTCCGSAGIYNVFQPTKAAELLRRKWGNIQKTGATIVATGNPGCLAWIAQACRSSGERKIALHTLDVLEASFSGLPDPEN